MNLKKLALATLAGCVAMWLLAGLWHMVIMPQFYMIENQAPHEGKAIIILGYLVLGLPMAFIYPIGYKNGRHSGNDKGAEKTFEAERIEKIYAARMAKKYDLSLPHSFATFKKKAFNDSSLKKGDRVLVFCCGTGLDFPHILQKIGKEGKITGVDFSAEMLNKAKEKIRKNKWENISLLEADVTKFEDKLDEKFDVGVCTLGMSIIPEFKSAYSNLLFNVKKQGQIIIGDMQLAPGWLARLNPVTIFISKTYGGTFEGHQNSLELYSMMKKELTEVKKREFFFKSYYYCIGKK